MIIVEMIMISGGLFGLMVNNVDMLVEKLVGGVLSVNFELWDEILLVV